MHHWLDTMPLHTAGGPRLVDVSEFVQGFLEGVSGLRFTTDGLTVMAISLVQFSGWVF